MLGFCVVLSWWSFMCNLKCDLVCLRWLGFTAEYFSWSFGLIKIFKLFEAQLNACLHSKVFRIEKFNSYPVLESLMPSEKAIHGHEQDIVPDFVCQFSDNWARLDTQSIFVVFITEFKAKKPARSVLFSCPFTRKSTQRCRFFDHKRLNQLVLLKPT